MTRARPAILLPKPLAEQRQVRRGDLDGVEVASRPQGGGERVDSLLFGQHDHGPPNQQR
jgi:hypothetical protein